MSKPNIWTDMTPSNEACDICAEKPARNCGSCGTTLCEAHANKPNDHVTGCIHRNDDRL